MNRRDFKLVSFSACSEELYVAGRHIVAVEQKGCVALLVNFYCTKGY